MPAAETGWQRCSSHYGAGCGACCQTAAGAHEIEIEVTGLRMALLGSTLIFAAAVVLVVIAVKRALPQALRVWVRREKEKESWPSDGDPSWHRDETARSSHGKSEISVQEGAGVPLNGLSDLTEVTP